MVSYEDYMVTDSLSDTIFIAGTDYIFNYVFYNSASALQDLSASTMKWVLSPYGQPDYAIMQKTATSSGSSMFVVKLTSNDTLGLGGVYLQQIELTDISGSKIRPAQGVVIIRKATPIE